MTALREIETRVTDYEDTLLRRNPEVFFDQAIASLQGSLHEYGEEQADFGDVKVLGAHVTENESFVYADGRDASRFFQQGDRGIAFRDEAGHILTPDLSIRIDMSETTSNTANGRVTTHRYYIAADGHIFEISMPQAEQRPPRDSHSISAPRALARSDDGGWTVATDEPRRAEVQAKRISVAQENAFMQNLLTLTSKRATTIARERAVDTGESGPLTSISRPYVKGGYLA